MKKVYAGIVLAGMMAAMLLVTGCPNPTSDDPVYSIGLEPTGSVVFTGATVGYPTQTARTVTVTNTGNQDTGELAIVKSGANPNRFTVSKPEGLASIAAGGTDTFTVVPNRSLAAGTYTATITVSGEHDISASFSVSFTVSPQAAYSIALSKTGTHNFPPAIVNYPAQTAETVTITNTGNQSTGSLTIAKLGTNAASFTVSKTSAADLAANGTDTFTVVPATGLAVGSYSATITVSGGNDLSASLNVSFRVNPTTPVFSVDLSETEPYEFPGAEAGYEEAPEEKEVTVTNTGNRATGALTIASSPANFTVTPASLAGIEESATGSFTVAPKTGLRAGTYDSTITVSGSGGISASFAVSFTVTPAYSVSLSETGTYPFPGAAVGYGAQAARTVTIRNTGDAATGALTIASGSDNFVVSKTGIADLALNGTDTFTVVPKAGLGAGSYTGTITVGGGNIPSASFDVSFTVAAASYGISLSGTSAFPEVFVGYGKQAAKAITITNTGNQVTGALTVGITGTGAASFTLPVTSIASIPGGETGSFTVEPDETLGVGTYEATITVSGGANITSQRFDVEFTVNAIGAPDPKIGLGLTGTYPFPSAVYGYGSQMPRTVAVNNTGNLATGTLSIGIGGLDNDKFEVSAPTLPSIGLSVGSSFTVVPKTGFGTTSGDATYSALITVTDTVNGNSASFTVSFTVIGPTYGISLSGTGAFATAYFGYAPLTARTVTIKNTGNQPTGPLTIGISGANSSDFDVSKIGSNIIADIEVGASDSFTVVPDTGLSEGGPYEAIITVSGGADITSQTLNVSFTVEPAPVYDIGLDQVGPHVFQAATVGYGAQTENTLTVTVANEGDAPTGPLTITKDPPNAGFTVSRNSLNSIAVSGNATFTVVPNRYLGVGTHIATITVGDTHSNIRTFDVSFTVNPVVYTVTFNAPGSAPATSTAPTIADSTGTGTVTLPMEPSRTGYTFAGWYTTPETGGSIFNPANVRADATVYARWLSSNANLAVLSVDAGDWDGISGNTYSISVPYATTSIEVRATKADANAVIQQYPSGNPVSLNVGSNIITVRVTAPDKTTAIDYTIIVTRQAAESGNANLGSLGVSVGALNPAFSPDITAYTVSVPSTTDEIKVEDTALADVRSEVVQSPGGILGTAVTLLDSGPTTINITVTAESGATKTYTVTVNKAQSDDSNAVNVAIGIGDTNIDLTKSTANDLSKEANASLILRAPAGGTYQWWVDGNTNGGAGVSATINASSFSDLGTHSVLLQFVKDDVTYGCEVQFRVVR
jgi:uncharacterized repeat protein (TIGR02543 family)